MKQFFFILLLVVSSNVFAQINNDTLIGEWQFENLTSENTDVLQNLSFDTFDLKLEGDNTFQLNNGFGQASGTWELKENTLLLTGKRPTDEKATTEKMTISEISDTQMKCEIKPPNQESVLVLHLKRKV